MHQFVHGPRIVHATDRPRNPDLKWVGIIHKLWNACLLFSRDIGRFQPISRLVSVDLKRRKFVTRSNLLIDFLVIFFRKVRNSVKDFCLAFNLIFLMILTAFWKSVGASYNIPIAQLGVNSLIVRRKTAVVKKRADPKSSSFFCYGSVMRKTFAKLPVTMIVKTLRWNNSKNYL